MKSVPVDRLLTDEDRILLTRTRELLENIEETLDILSNPDTLKQLEESEEDVKAGRVRPYEELREEMRKAGQLRDRGD